MFSKKEYRPKTRKIKLTVEMPDGAAQLVLDLRNPADNFSSFDPILREAIAKTIRRYPNTGADWWIGPEAVLGTIENYITGGK